MSFAGVKAAEINFKLLQIRCSDIIKEQSLVIIKLLLPFYFSFITQRLLYLIMFSLLVRSTIKFITLCRFVSMFVVCSNQLLNISKYQVSCFLLNQDLWFYCDNSEENKIVSWSTCVARSASLLHTKLLLQKSTNLSPNIFIDKRMKENIEKG